jgi:hypothetical protein
VPNLLLIGHEVFHTRVTTSDAQIGRTVRRCTVDVCLEGTDIATSSHEHAYRHIGVATCRVLLIVESIYVVVRFCALVATKQNVANIILLHACTKSIACINFPQKGFVFLKNGLFVHEKRERPFSLKGCSFIKNV